MITIKNIISSIFNDNNSTYTKYNLFNKIVCIKAETYFCFLQFWIDKIAENY